jgi:hypothetical protein
VGFAEPTRRSVGFYELPLIAVRGKGAGKHRFVSARDLAGRAFDVVPWRATPSTKHSWRPTPPQGTRRFLADDRLLDSLTIGVQEVAIHDRGADGCTAYGRDKQPGVSITKAASLAQLLPEVNIIDVFMDEHVQVTQDIALNQVTHWATVLIEGVDQHVVGGVSIRHRGLSIPGHSASQAWQAVCVLEDDTHTYEDRRSDRMP